MMRKRDERIKKRGALGVKGLLIPPYLFILTTLEKVLERPKTIRTALSKKHDLSGTVLKDTAI